MIYYRALGDIRAPSLEALSGPRMKIDPEALAKEFAALPDLPQGFNAQEEAEHLAALVERPELAPRLTDYDDPHAEGAGGSGAVISAHYKPFNIRRAIKLPRKGILEAARAGQIPRVDPELHALSKVSHQNIIRLHDAFPISGGEGQCIITEYVVKPRYLDRFAVELCCGDDCRTDETLRKAAIRRLARTIYSVVDALRYMNDVAKLIHFDVKPPNILVSTDGYPFVTDLGLARDTGRYAPDEKVEVGFTWKYAHPLLLDPHHGARVSEDAAKARNVLFGKQLQPQLDVFAFGRTIQEALFALKQVYGDSINSDYTYNYLHIIASLCLDGHNSADETDDKSHSFVSDRALEMPRAVFSQHRLASFAAIKLALDRLLGFIRIEDEVPEVDSWAGSTINVSDLGITTWTSRLRSICEHPAVERLAGELQLGMLDMIFPTASHSRLQHSLGTYHASREYITALYYDPDNPMFRVLFSEADCRRSLLASLVHDLGHTNFGHDLEEVDNEEFSHQKIGDAVIQTTGFRDSHDRTLRDLIEGAGTDCWNVKLDDLSALLHGALSKPIDGVYRDILEGQLDADKLDYLIRDSIESRVPYGRGIDDRRFLRSLTTIAEGNGDSGALRLAIKNKGAASAEAFAFARYQLYQSLYWHHTFRAVKSMFVTAAADTINELRKSATADLLDRYPFRTAYLRHVIGITTEPKPVSPSKKGQRGETPSIRQRIEELLSVSGEPEGGKYAKDKTLRFLWKLAKGRARKLVDDLVNRKYYKRILEIPLGDLSERGWIELSGKFRGRQRLELQEGIQRTLLDTLITAIQDQSATRASLVRDAALEAVNSIKGERFAIIIDLPLRGWTASGEEPIFVSDYKRRYFRTSVGLHKRAKSGTLWSDVGQMMRRIAFFRIFCEPRIHQIITRVLRTPVILKTVADEVPQLKTLLR